MRENDADDWETVLPWLLDLRRKGIAVCIVHHSGRNGTNMRGICKLTDGRSLAVEYKGSHLWADAEDKRSVGAVWQSRSAGQCIFVMPSDGDFSVITAAIK